MGTRAAILGCISLNALFLWGFSAESQTESPNATFKRIKVGDKSSGPLINIQIDPEEQALALAAPTPTPDTTNIENAIIADPSKGNDTSSEKMQPWFWNQIGDNMALASADRMNDAVLQMSQAPDGFYAPRAEHFNTLAKNYGAQILTASISTNVSPALILAVIGVESSGDQNAISSAGAKGLMQLIPATAERFGVKDITDPAQNIAGGVAYLDWLLREFKGDPLLALAAYNAGENAVKKNGGIPAYAETRTYVPKVVAAWQVARNLCATRPELVSEPCVFRVQALGASK